MESTDEWSHKKDYLFKFVPSEVRAQLLLDEEAAYSVTDQFTADRMTRDIVNITGCSGVICDATACIGGNTASFAKAFRHVIAIEKDKCRFDMLSNNMNILKAMNVRCVHGDAIEELAWGCTGTYRSIRDPDNMYDVIFVDPPWGGKEYKSQEKLSLELSGRSIQDIFRDWSKYTRYFAIKTPLNFDESTFQSATTDFLTLKHRNNQLRKVTFYLYEVIK